MTIELDRPVLCKVCRVLVGYSGRDEYGLIFEPLRNGSVSVATVGTYCSVECKLADPDYHAALDDAHEAARREHEGRLKSEISALKLDVRCLKVLTNGAQKAQPLVDRIHQLEGELQSLEVCHCGHPQDDHLNGEAACLGKMGRCDCRQFQRAA